MQEANIFILSKKFRKTLLKICRADKIKYKGFSTKKTVFDLAIHILKSNPYTKNEILILSWNDKEEHYYVKKIPKKEFIPPRNYDNATDDIPDRINFMSIDELKKEQDNLELVAYNKGHNPKIIRNYYNQIIEERKK